MKTEIEEVPKASKRASRKEFTPEDIVNAVENAFRNNEGSSDIRHLWTDGHVHRFRVNCWLQEKIQGSFFVRVVEENQELKVTKT